MRVSDEDASRLQIFSATSMYVCKEGQHYDETFLQKEVFLLVRLVSGMMQFYDFFANHVWNIQNLTHSLEWRYFFTLKNPADILIESCLWWQRPPYLTKAQEDRPGRKIIEKPALELDPSILFVKSHINRSLGDILANSSLADASLIKELPISRRDFTASLATCFCDI